MIRDKDRSNQGGTTPDDERLAALIRSTVDDWHMPPQRLDQPTWRDRVGVEKRRRRGWFARLAGPATAAVVGTVVVAFVAVWLTTPRADQGLVGKPPSTSPGASAATSNSTGPSTSPSGTPKPTASTLPSMFLAGELPDPSRLMVRAGAGYRVADLSTGALASVSIGAHGGPTTLLPKPGGGWLCICGEWVGSGFGKSPSGLQLTVETIEADGTAGERASLKTLTGSADPGLPSSTQPEFVDARVTASPDGQVAFVGWSARHGANGWTSGIDVLDLRTAKVVSSTSLAVDELDRRGGPATTRLAPEIAVSGEIVLISRPWYVDDGSAAPASGTDHWSASYDGKTVGTPRPAGSTVSKNCEEFDSGLIDPSRYYVQCWTPDSKMQVERYDLDGTALDSVDVYATVGGLDGGALSSRTGNRLFVWDPVGAVLARIDLTTLELKTTTATASVGSSSPIDVLAAIGRKVGHWIAPSVVAKVYLEPAIAVSADGTRVYALGIDRANGEEALGSHGVFAFDTNTLESVGHWAPTADFISLAVSPDGRFVYAAGDARRTAAGTPSQDAASITVYDASNGSVRLIAGKLGLESILFPGPIVR